MLNLKRKHTEGGSRQNHYVKRLVILTEVLGVGDILSSGPNQSANLTRYSNFLLKIHIMFGKIW